MLFIDSRGWFEAAEHCPSPNYGLRPEGCEISLLVIHNISLPPGQFGGRYIHELFCNCLDCDAKPEFEELRDVKVSSHLLIDRQGGLTQFVSTQARAWHAGVSFFNGLSNCNDFSVGIELEGTDDVPYTPLQYEQLAQVTKALMARYPLISTERIVGHSDIAPGRKTDPGPAFDWTHYKNRLS